MQLKKITYLSVSPKGRNLDTDGRTVLKLILKNQDMASREKNQYGQIFLFHVQHIAGIFLCGTTSSSAQKVCFPITLVVFEDYTHTHTHTHKNHILQSDRYVYLLTLLSL